MVSITKLDSGYYLTLMGDAEGLIKSGQTGCGTITNSPNTYHPAPNGSGYSVQFSVSSSAIPGDSIPFNLKLTDSKNNSWNLSFNLLIK